MHIPGHGFITLPTAATTAVVSTAALGVAVRGLRARRIGGMGLKMALVAAFVFAAQMFNFPIAGGTSGHLIGALFAAVLLGPYAATAVMAVVLLVQCALFGDGGYFSLGANVFNMAVVATWVGWAFFRGLGGASAPSRYMALFIGSWASTVAAASACSLEIALSGTASVSAVLPAMVLTHSTIGVGEGVITVVAYALVSSLIPSLRARRTIEQGA